MNKTSFITRTGKQFDLLAPKIDAITIEDIAWALSMQCRFNGHVPQFYSVAEHCIRASQMVEPRYRLTALLHDAAEAYMGDLSALLKEIMPEFVSIESNIEQFIAVKFGIIYPFPAAVLKADTDMLEIEQLWRSGKATIHALNPRLAYANFLNEYNVLVSERNKLNGLLK